MEPVLVWLFAIVLVMKHLIELALEIQAGIPSQYLVDVLLLQACSWNTRDVVGKTKLHEAVRVAPMVVHIPCMQGNVVPDFLSPVFLYTLVGQERTCGARALNFKPVRTGGVVGQPRS